jgi:aryl-alcohol dehydrogenase-like predicted oxidoreductase
VRSGKARYIGVSTMLTGQLAKILMACERNGWVKPINMQLQLNCAYREEEREMIPFCRDQGLGVSVFSPLARGLLTGDVQSTRNQTDFFTQQMYSDEASFEIAHSVQRVARARGVQRADRPGVGRQPSGRRLHAGRRRHHAQFDSAAGCAGHPAGCR